MNQTTTTQQYRVTLERPSHSKCPNAWAKMNGSWVHDEIIADHGSTIELGGSIRRATRIEHYRETITIDEVGSWSAWWSGSITVEAI